MTKKIVAVALTSIALCLLAGCATDVEPGDETPSTPVVTDNTAPALTNTGGGTCTTTTECDSAYCCTTETCPYSTMVTCVPAPKKTKNGTYALSP